MRSVKCIRCSEKINRQVDPFVQVGQRYAHKKCEDLFLLENEERKKLNEVLLHVFGKNEVNWGAVQQQVKKYQEEYNYTLNGIARTLYYVFSIKKLSFKNADGIGITPFYYKEAKKYYEKLNKAKSNAQGTLLYNIKEVEILPPHKTGTKKKSFDLNFL